MRILPAGATALDFAYSIHTLVGNHCIGAKVNHKLEPMSYKLQGGDQVEILTSVKPKVDRAWLDIATTAKAKTKIQAALRKQERELRKTGELMFDEFLANHDIQRESSVIDRLCHFHSANKADDLFLAIGQGTVSLSTADVDFLTGKNSNAGWRRLLPFGKKRTDTPVPATVSGNSGQVAYDKKKPVELTETGFDTQFRLEPCCNPIHGDKAVACLAADHILHVHKLQCPEALRLKANNGNNLYAIKWGAMPDRLFSVTILLSGIDKVGLLNQITEVISQLLGVNMRRLELSTNDGVFEGRITLYGIDIGVCL